MTCGVFLYRKSRLFWTFPDPPVGRPPPNDPFYRLTSDARVQNVHITTRGPSPADYYPVKMPNLTQYTEAVFLLKIRDIAGQRTLVRWGVELNHLVGALNDRNANMEFDDLSEPCREYDLHMDGDQGYRLEHEVYAVMKEKNELPPPDQRPIDPGMTPMEERLRKLNISFNPA